jgi:hypothetical protein
MTRSTGVVPGVGRSQEDLGSISGSHPSGHARCAVDGASRIDPGRAEFTPGPWGYSFDKKDTGFEGDTFMAGPLHCDGTAGFSSVVEGGLVLADDNENEANARLIAAAPELYEALAELEAALLDGLCNSGVPGFDPDRLERARFAARSALAKARGEVSQ